MAGDLSIEQCGSLFAATSRKASSNYGIGSDGRIGMYVEEKDRSWCTSSASNDNRAVTIEVANDGGQSSGWHVSDAAMNSLILLCADICNRNNIPKLLWEGNPSLIGQVNRQNMTVHRWFSKKDCPGNYLYSKHSYIADEVNKKLRNPSSITAGGQPGGSEYGYVEPSSLVDVSKIHPYIATISYDAQSIDCNALKQADVVGVMLYGGCHYTPVHTIREYYRGDNLKKQVACADAGDMPYGLYVYVRARSAQEAEQECRYLWYVVSKYPPELGVWLRIETGKSKTINDSILDVYYKYAEKWGMKDKFGLYVSRNTLREVSWDNFYDKYLLWLIEPVQSMEGVDDTLLNPEFFLLGGL